MTETDEQEHSPLGPSSLSRIFACPGSFALSQLPEVKARGNRSSIYSAKGTFAHGLAERILKDEALPDPGMHRVRGHDVDFDEDMLDAVRKHTDMLETSIAVADWHAVEQRVSLDHLWAPGKPPVPIFGTSDFMAYFRSIRRLQVVDYKHGVGVIVDIIDNPQLLAYAAGGIDIAPGPVDTIELTIVQPNASGPKVKTRIITRAELLIWIGLMLVPKVNRVLTEPDVFVDGPQCRFCPASFLCPRLHEQAIAEAQAQFRDDDDETLDPKAPLTPTKLAAALDRAESLEHWIKAVRAHAKDVLTQDPDMVPGWTLQTVNRREWDDEHAVRDDLVMSNANPEDIYEIKSPAQIEKRFGDSDIWTLVSGHIVSKPVTRLIRDNNQGS